MVKKTATVEYPAGLPQALKQSDSAFEKEIKFVAAAKLFELGRISSGIAAQIAEMSRADFLNRLAEIGVPAINLRDEEIDHEIEAARRLSN
jgi:predicted HTH domain antitoxin